MHAKNKHDLLKENFLDVELCIFKALGLACNTNSIVTFTSCALNFFKKGYTRGTWNYFNYFKITLITLAKEPQKAQVGGPGI